MNNIEFRGKYHDYQVRWNQPLPTRDELERQWEEEKIWYRWEEKSAYEERGPITGIQVATDQQDPGCEWINRIRFAFNHTFEEWRATPGIRGVGQEGQEEDPFLLEEGEQVVEVKTYKERLGLGLCGLELVTTSGRRVFFGRKDDCNCKTSVTKETFLAYCSGGHFSLTFHWEQNKPTPCT